MMDLETMTEDEAKAILRSLKMAGHAAIHHPDCRTSETRDGEWLVMACGLGCPIHFTMILREKPAGPFGNYWMFLNFFMAIWEPESSMSYGANGMEIYTAAGSGSVMMDSYHG